jgi:hypothetical protein
MARLFKIRISKAPKLNSNNQIAEIETLENNKLRSGPIKVKERKTQSSRMANSA